MRRIDPLVLAILHTMQPLGDEFEKGRSDGRDKYMTENSSPVAATRLNG